MLDSFGGFNGLINEVLLEGLVKIVVNLCEFLGFVEFLDVVVEFEEFNYVCLFEKFFIVFHHSFNMVFHFLEFFRGQRRFQFLNEAFLLHHSIIDDGHFVQEPSLF